MGTIETCEDTYVEFGHVAPCSYCGMALVTLPTGGVQRYPHLVWDGRRIRQMMACVDGALPAGAALSPGARPQPRTARTNAEDSA